MPWFRTKLLPGSKILQKQKRWWRGWLGARCYLSLRTPINMLKAKSVALESQLMRTRLEIEILEKEYAATVKHLGSATMHDVDGGAVTQWKFEKNRWYKFSAFQWAIPYIDEPPAFDAKMYRFGTQGWGAGTPPPRQKDVEIGVNSLAKDAKAFREEMSEQRDPANKGPGVLATFNPGKGDRGIQRGKGETQEHFDKRKEDAKGSVDGME